MAQSERTILNPPRTENADTVSVADVLSSAVRAVRRQLWFVVLTTAACLMLAILGIVTSTRIYTASTTIYIDPRESSSFQQAGGVILNSDALLVDSEVEILLSSTLAERVIDRLGLADVADPASTAPSLTARLKEFFLPVAGDEGDVAVLSPEEAAKRRAVSELQRNVEVGRLGDTYVIEITVKNADKQLAAKIANTYTDEYLKSSLEIQAGRLAQLNSWSTEALREAISSLQQAETEINQFRLVNKIDSGVGQVAGAELTETNTALVKVRNDRFQNELMLERVQEFLSDGSTDSDVPDVGVEGIAQIRSEILQAELDYARETANGNKQAPQALVLLRELDAMKGQLIDQYQRIATQLEKQIQFSIAEEGRLTERAETLRRDVADISGKEAKLGELQMKADGERAVYQALLTRFNETSDVVAYNANSARVLTAASVPAGPSSPQTAKILALGMFAGLFMSMVAIFFREQFDDGIRRPLEVEATGLRYLGAVPMVGGAWLRVRGRRDLNAPVLVGRRRRREMAMMTYAVDFPLSEFSETVRSIVFDASAGKRSSARGQIVAVTSIASGEGKTVLAANLAAYFAKQGKRVHLIDFDLKNPTLSRIFAARPLPAPPPDDLALPGEAYLEKKRTVRLSNERTADFEFSGQMEQLNASDRIEFVSPNSIAAYLEEVKTNFDIVVLDLGSLSDSSDARMCSDLADYVVLAVKWGLTSAEQFERSLTRGLNRSDRSVGAVLTMVPPAEKLERPTAGDKAARRLAAA